MSPENPEKSPSAFQDPTTFPVLLVKTPKEVIVGRNKWILWKIKTTAEDAIAPSKTVFARFGVERIIEDKNIKIKLQNINQNEPKSKAVPKRDTCGLPDKSDEIKKTRTIPNPDKRSHDFGKDMHPSRNRAIAQKIAQAVSPTTTSRPLEVSIGMLLKGKKKNGSKVITKNSDKNESLSNVFVFMGILYQGLLFMQK